MPTAQELSINTNATAEEMANAIFGDGVAVWTASYSGDALSSGIYSGADTTVAGVAPGDSGVILSTGYVRDFTNSDGSTNTNQSAGTSTNTSGANNDSDFNALAGTGTRDASFLEISFVPQGDFITIDFVIASEEYPEYVNSQYNDVIGVWVNDQLAQVTIGDGSASIGNINGDDTQNLYVDNTGDQYNTEMDGFTITLTFVAPVNAGEFNTLKIGVADVADSSYDTNLLIAGGSVQSSIVAQDDSVTIPGGRSATLNVLGNDSSSAGGVLTVTHINGTAVVAGQRVELATGQFITLNDDGTFFIERDSDTETVYFNYEIQDADGNTDTAIVEIVQEAPCFAQGTQLLTDRGPVDVADLTAGMRVWTRDSGFQIVRWIGSRSVDATGKDAPILIRSGSYDAQQDVRVSPQHRVLVGGVWAELLFGEAEVLVKAKDLVNDATVCVDRSCETVTYFHLLFDRHEIVSACGLLSESYHPGPQTMKGFDPETQSEILRLFPDLDVETGQGYSPAARRALKSYEAATLISAQAA